MFFSSIKEINTLLRKGMSNIYLESTYWEKVKLCVAILLFSLWKEIWRFKIKESMIFAEQKYSFNKNESESKMENITHNFTEMNLVLRLE